MGVADSFNVIILERFKSFLFFSSRKYQLLNFKTGERRFLTEKELKAYIEEHGKLDAGKSFHLNGYVLSNDRNYFLVNSFMATLFRNYSDLRQRRYELLVFKYSGDN
jgi:hypothetical protein